MIREGEIERSLPLFFVLTMDVVCGILVGNKEVKGMNGLSRKELLPDPKGIEALRKAIAERKTLVPKIDHKEVKVSITSEKPAFTNPLSEKPPHPFNAGKGRGAKRWMSIRPEDIKIGQKLFYVHALGQRSYTSFGIVASLPYESKDNGTFFDVSKHFEDDVLGKTYREPWSLLDGNCIPNFYNFHRIYDDEDKARRYLIYCKTGNRRLVDREDEW